MLALRTFAIAALMLVGSILPASAQAMNQQQFEALMQWGARSQQILQVAVAPLQNMAAPFDHGTPAERAAWVSQARGWVSGYRAALQDARRQTQQLGPVPEAGPVSRVYEQQARGLEDLFASLDGFLDQYDQGVTAIERNDPQALHISLVNAVDAQLLLQTQFRNLNALQAESVGASPQQHLLRSFSSSYDGLIALLRARRASYFGQDENAQSVAAIRSAADSMRQSASAGRIATRAAEAALPASVPPEQSDFIRRVRLAYQTFYGSFDREEQIAVTLDDLARLLDSGSYSAVELQLDQVLNRLGVLDYERLADMQRRTALVQAVSPT